LNLSMSERFRKIPNLEVNEVPDGYVIYQSDRDRVHFLNSTAAAILELCDSEHSLEDIAEILKAAYDLDAAPEEDIRRSVESLVAEGLILPCKE
jgi:Coenzyme PQQ synthesis protein D (PqqD)